MLLPETEEAIRKLVREMRFRYISTGELIVLMMNILDKNNALEQAQEIIKCQKQ